MSMTYIELFAVNMSHCEVLDAEIAGLEVEIATAKQRNTDVLAVMDAEIEALEVEVAAAKIKRINDLAAKDAEIAELKTELAAVESL